MTTHCCSDMTRHVEMKCPDHPVPQNCPDRVLKYSSRFNEYGLVIHDGGSASYSIRFCPFCGVKLPASRRDN
ncbi:DUF6980 family protein [Dyella telluris]|uniref:DUF6980 family protein n=1 Tax=Dyella telluris TaxID=2763498 RepID=UPI003CCD9F31